MKKIVFIILPLFILLSGCANTLIKKKSSIHAEQFAFQEHAAIADCKSPMWKIQGDKNIVYLLGSIHYGKKNSTLFQMRLRKHFLLLKI